MGLFDKQTRDLDEQIAALRAEISVLKTSRESAERRLDLADEAVKLKEQIEALKIQKDRIAEDNAREKRETLHMVGLERKRQEFEAEQAKKELDHAKRDATLVVRQENLTAERAAFQKEMDFREKRFTEEVGYLKDLMGQILDRLPNISESRTVTSKTTKTV